MWHTIVKWFMKKYIFQKEKYKIRSWAWSTFAKLVSNIKEGKLLKVITQLNGLISWNDYKESSQLILYNSAICWENYYLQLRFVPAAKDKMKKLKKKDGEDDVDEDKDDPVVTADNFLLNFVLLLLVANGRSGCTCINNFTVLVPCVRCYSYISK